MFVQAGGDGRLMAIAKVIAPSVWVAGGLKHPDDAAHKARLKVPADATHPLTPQGTTAPLQGPEAGD